ncbi:XdhC family protein, partial [Bordetella pertussis]|uniref:XdhC family protein n=1 Tax=Bordetella pertussis TaxID=520 RepID=UPI003879E165
SRPPAWASRACRRWRRPWPTPSPRPPASACARCRWAPPSRHEEHRHASRRPVRVAIRADGAVAGSVSGGCIEDDLIDQIRQ